MSLNPFAADPPVSDRLAGQDGPAIHAAAIAALAPGRILPAGSVAAIVRDFALAGPDDLMLHLVDTARTYAVPPISAFFVGVVGRAATGDMILGCNVEFPGSHLAFTIHGEGFVMTRAFQLGTTVAAIALGEAHPCAHCRQYISEFAGVRDMVLFDPLGHRLRMAELYPWPFDPGYLGQTGAVPGVVNFPDLLFAGDGPPLLLHAGQRAWSPYSGCPGALLLEMADGAQVAGPAVESVSFNPTIQPVQSAMIAALAHGYAAADIRAAWLGTVAGGAVDYAASTAELLGVIAPQATLVVCGWSLPARKEQ